MAKDCSSKSERAEDASASLSALERDVLLLSAHAGLRNEEIAAVLQISPRRVERLLARALLKFDRELSRMERPWRRGSTQKENDP